MHSRTPAYLQLDPSSEITFNYVPRKYLSSSLRLTNIVDHPVAFKVKTNVPVCYLVKPHSGTLPPKCSVDISITMQPTEYNPQNASISDKFLVNAVPLPESQDLSALSDPALLQQIWETVPKERLQANKLKVVLKFESSLRSSTTNLNKTTELDSSKVTDRESLSESTRKDMETSDFKSVINNETSFREDLGSSTMMMSFSNDVASKSPLQKSSILGEEPNSGTRKERENVGITKPVIQEKELEKRASVVNVREDKNVNEDNRLLEKADFLEKNIDELIIEKKMLNQRYQELLGKGEEQKRLLFELSEENTRLKSELSNLKSSTFQEKTTKKDGQNDGSTYELWHVLVVAIVAMIVGAFLSSK